MFDFAYTYEPLHRFCDCLLFCLIPTKFKSIQLCFNLLEYVKLCLTLFNSRSYAQILCLFKNELNWEKPGKQIMYKNCKTRKQLLYSVSNSSLLLPHFFFINKWGLLLHYKLRPPHHSILLHKKILGGFSWLNEAASWHAVIHIRSIVYD